MSSLEIPERVKNVIALFSASKEVLDSTIEKLECYFGDIDYISGYFNFLNTSYYSEEMGDNLIFVITSFKRLVERYQLPIIKDLTCDIEEKYSKLIDGELKREVNIDPGLLSLENFILATGKGYSHRIYLDKGVWADLTLIYDKKTGYKSLPWTYPNYDSKEIKESLLIIRNKYYTQLKEMRK